MNSSQLILLDIFSYSCMNCLRSLRYIKKINKRYKKHRLEVILVHPPEWEFEKNKANIIQSFKKQEITFPFITDKNKKIINNLKVDFWPAQILMRSGKVLYKHIGEGGYKQLEDRIVSILKVNSKRIFDKEPSYSKLPAVYLGKKKRGRLLNNKNKLGFGTAYAEGNWTQKNEYMECKGKECSLTTLTKGRVVYIVASSLKKVSMWITIKIDNKTIRRMMISKPNLYYIAKLNNPNQHKLTLLTKSGLAVYSFAFE